MKENSKETHKNPKKKLENDDPELRNTHLQLPNLWFLHEA